MGTFLKYAGLIFGVTLVFWSFLFFGRQQNVYEICLITGLIVSLLFFIIILLGKHSLKAKIAMVAFVVLCVFLEQISEPKLIDASYKRFIKQNNSALTEINNLLLNKPGDILILNNEIKDQSSLLTPSEKQKVLDNRQKLRVYMISRTNDEIYYGLWGFLDVRLGLTYWTSNSEPNKSYRHLIGRWYH